METLEDLLLVLGVWSGVAGSEVGNASVLKEIKKEVMVSLVEGHLSVH